MELSNEKKQQASASQEQQLNRSADALDGVTSIQRQSSGDTDSVSAAPTTDTDSIQDDEIDTLEDTPSMEGMEQDEDDETYHATSSDQTNADNLKEGFGKDEYAKTLENKDYYKEKDKELHEELDKAKEESKEQFRELTPAERKRFDRQQERKKKKEEREKNRQVGAIAGATQAGAGQNGLNGLNNKKGNGKKGPGKNNKETGHEITSVKKQKSGLDKLKDKKKILDAKKNIAMNKVAGTKAKIYEIMHPIQALKNTIKNLGKKALKALGKLYVKVLKIAPIPVLIVTGVLIVTIPIVLLIAGLSIDSNPSKNYNKYDYTQVVVKVVDDDKDPVQLSGAALGSAYVHFFINEEIYKENYTDLQLQNMFATYLLYTKTTLLGSWSWLNMNYDVSRYEDENADYRYTVMLSSDDDAYPSYCDPYLGCYMPFAFLGINAHYEACSSDDDDCPHVSLFDFPKDSREAHVAELLVDVSVDLYDYIAAPYSKIDVITKVDSSFGVKFLSKSLFKSIINLYKDHPECAISIYKEDENGNKLINREHLHDQLSILQSGASDDNACKPSNLTVRAYNIQDFIVDKETAYQDIGFWLPIGSIEALDDGTYSGEPAKYAITDSFGYRINDDGNQVFHSGIDLATYGVDDKVPVLAVGDGVVTVQTCTPYTGSCGFNQTSKEYGGGGCQITIDHGNGIVSRYLHLSAPSIYAYVSQGDEVKRGQVIGRVGSTGCSTGPHLHFEIRENGKAINPLNYVSEQNARSTKETGD